MASRSLAPPKLTAWSSWEEWLATQAAVAEALRGASSAATGEAAADALHAACVALRVWVHRGRAPLAVFATQQLLSIAETDAATSARQLWGGGGGGDLEQVRLAYSMALVRLVNGMADSGQRGVYAQSVLDCARRLGLPRSLVDLRHESTHGALPSLPMLRAASRDALEWLRGAYWERQRLHLEARLALADGDPARWLHSFGSATQEVLDLRLPSTPPACHDADALRAFARAVEKALAGPQRELAASRSTSASSDRRVLRAARAAVEALPTPAGVQWTPPPPPPPPASSAYEDAVEAAGSAAAVGEGGRQAGARRKRGSQLQAAAPSPPPPALEFSAPSSPSGDDFLGLLTAQERLQQRGAAARASQAALIDSLAACAHQKRLAEVDQGAGWLRSLVSLHLVGGSALLLHVHHDPLSSATEPRLAAFLAEWSRLLLRLWRVFPHLPTVLTEALCAVLAQKREVPKPDGSVSASAAATLSPPAESVAFPTLPCEVAWLRHLCSRAWFAPRHWASAVRVCIMRRGGAAATRHLSAQVLLGCEDALLSAAQRDFLASAAPTWCLAGTPRLAPPIASPAAASPLPTPLPRPNGGSRKRQRGEGGGGKEAAAAAAVNVDTSLYLVLMTALQRIAAADSGVGGGGAALRALSAVCHDVGLPVDDILASVTAGEAFDDEHDDHDGAAGHPPLTTAAAGDAAPDNPLASPLVTPSLSLADFEALLTSVGATSVAAIRDEAVSAGTAQLGGDDRVLPGFVPPRWRMTARWE